MQAGSKVEYVTADGEHAAIVHEVTGTGKSLFKILTLSYKSGDEGRAVAERVPHENDAERSDSGEPVPPFWRETGPARREQQAPLEPVPGGGVPSGEIVSVPILPEPEDVDSVPAASRTTRARGGKRTT